MEFFIYLAIMALSTYAIRAIPLVLANRKITNRFLRSFLHYIPYAVLTAITVPAGIFATGNIVSAAAGLFCAIMVSGKTGNLFISAGTACAVAWITATIMSMV